MGGCSLKITQGLHEPIRRDENLRITIPIEVKRLDGYRLEPPGVSRYLDPSCLVTYSAKREILDGSNQLVVSTRIHSVLFDRIAAYTEVA